MKVALVVPEFPPDAIGGGGVVFEALAERYSSSVNVSVRVFTAWDSCRSWTKHSRVESRAGFDVHRYPLIPILRQRLNLRSVLPPNPIALTALAKDLRQWRPDVGHLHGYGCATVDLAHWLMPRLPYVFTLHGLPLTPYRERAAVRGAYQVYQRTFASSTLRRAAALTAVSGGVAAQVSPRYRPEVVPNGVDPLGQPDPEAIARARETLELRADDFVVMGIGRLERVKGFDILLDALFRLEVQRRVVCVLIGADGDQAAELRSRARAAPPGVVVRFAGRMSRDALAAAVASAVVVAVPSRYESFSLVGLEALTAGVPVVASAVGGLRDYVSEGLGALVPPGDPDALARALQRFAALPVGALRVDEVAIARLEREYSWDSVAQRYLSQLSVVAGGEATAR